MALVPTDPNVRARPDGVNAGDEITTFDSGNVFEATRTTIANVMAKVENTNAGGDNFATRTGEGNVINPDSHSCSMSGGSAALGNVIGYEDGNAQGLSLPQVDPNWANGNAGSYNHAHIIGYDNLANGLASHVFAHHGIASLASDHGGIFGGSYGRILEGSYNALIGGGGGDNSGPTDANSIGTIGSTGVNRSAVVGGARNHLDGNQSVILGGEDNTIDSTGVAFDMFNNVLCAHDGNEDGVTTVNGSIAPNGRNANYVRNNAILGGVNNRLFQRETVVLGWMGAGAMRGSMSLGSSGHIATETEARASLEHGYCQTTMLTAGATALASDTSNGSVPLRAVAQRTNTLGFIADNFTVRVSANVLAITEDYTGVREWTIRGLINYTNGTAGPAPNGYTIAQATQIDSNTDGLNIGAPNINEPTFVTNSNADIRIWAGGNNTGQRVRWTATISLAIASFG